MAKAASSPISMELILGLTSYAAGTVDIISFAKLGGVFASAMTGNLAFLGYYLSQNFIASAAGAAIALASFVVGSSAGTMLSRNRDQAASLRLLLGMETLLLGGTVAVWVSTYHPNGSFGRDAIIALLAISMGLQVIIGKRLNLSNIPTVVFTSTLTNIVIGLTELMANRNLKFPTDAKRQCGAFMLYFTGALTAGLCLHFNVGILIFLPVLAAAAAFASSLMLPV